MATFTKSPASSGDPRNLVWHTMDNGATWYSSWTLSIGRVIDDGEGRTLSKNARNTVVYEMPHDSILTVANTLVRESGVRSVARQYDGALLD